MLDLNFQDLIAKMAPKVKLMYFDIRARAEIIRIMLNYGGVEFEDKRVQNADWPKVKPSKTRTTCKERCASKLINIFQPQSLVSCQS